MGRRITVILGHPDPAEHHFGHALGRAYAEGAEGAGHEVRMIEVGKLDFAMLRSKDEFEKGQVPAAIREAQETIAWAEHLVIVFPLWLGTMPAVFKGFLEQVFRPGFAFEQLEGGGLPKKRLAGRSARVVVTMGMPAPVYRWFYRAHSVKGLKRNILGFCGIGPIKENLIGLVEGEEATRQRWLERMRELGRAGA